MKIVIVSVKTTPAQRGSRPVVYFNLVGESVMNNLLDRHSRPYNEFKKVLDQAMDMAGLAIRSNELGWSQYAGCSCPCSPGFIVKSSSGFGLRGQNVWVSYRVEEGENEKPAVTYRPGMLENASMFCYSDYKDTTRAKSLKSIGEAQKMAKLITDPYKIVARTNAVVKECTYEYRKPFIERMRVMGFTEAQILKVIGINPKTASVILPKKAVVA